MNLRPSGYEPDELPGCSTPRHQSVDRKQSSGDKNAAATRKGKRRRTSTCEWVSLVPAGCKAWRRPTLPQLKLKYHRRCLVSRPSSGWDRVGHRRYGHQAMKPAGRESSRNRCGPNGPNKKAAARLPGSGFKNIANGFLLHAASKAWRRPTLPLLKQ